MTQELYYLGEYALTSLINQTQETSHILLSRERDSVKNVILKVVKKLSNNVTEKEILEFSKKNRNNFIVECFDTFQTPGHIIMVLENVEAGNLAEHLLRSKGFTVARSIFYACNVILALEFLHFHNIFHRDVSLENLLLCEDGYLKLCDFGFSIVVTLEKSKTMYFMRDIKQLASIVCEMIKGSSNEISDPCFNCSDWPLQDIPTIKKHFFFKNINWDRVRNKTCKAPSFEKTFCMSEINSNIKGVWKELNEAEEIKLKELVKTPHIECFFENVAQ